MICAFVLTGDDDRMQGAVRVRCFAPREDELLSQLEWLVTDVTKPEFTASLLAWYEQVVAAHWEARGLTLPRAFRVATHVDDAALAGAMASCGYRLSHAEDRMRLELDGDPPDAPAPKGLRAVGWAPEHVPAFYDAYSRSFRERPGFPNWSQAAWAEAFSGYDSFRPDLSTVLLDGGRPVAFLLAAVDPDCWVVQMGVVPSHRRRGLGKALLAGLQRRAHEEGCGAMMLSVNLDNPNARRLYEGVGYRRVGVTTVYRKA